MLAGAEALCEAAALPEADTVVVAVCGFAALRPTLTAIHEKKRIALANKETMVCAGQIMQAAARESGAEIIPVDSEHSAIFQCLMGCLDRAEVKRLILTCSGGPFFGKTREELVCMTKSDALRHPNWKMGAKITVDCATLMNKGLEIIEAMQLYERLSMELMSIMQYRDAVKVLRRMRDLCELVPDLRTPNDLNRTWQLEGDCYRYCSDFSKAITAYETFLERAKLTKYERMDAQCSYCVVLYESGEISRPLEHLRTLLSEL